MSACGLDTCNFGCQYKDDPRSPCYEESERRVDEGWQSIDTAPRDGTVVLVANGAEGGYGGAAGESSTPYNIGTAYFRVYKNGKSDWLANDCCDGVSTYKPTHWMPLPTPPAT